VGLQIGHCSCLLSQCQEKWGDSSLSSYALELLTVYAWEQGCNAEAFDIAAGVRTVLQLILQQEQLCIYWTVNYNFEVETIRNTLLYQLRSQRCQASHSLPPSLHLHPEKVKVLPGEPEMHPKNGSMVGGGQRVCLQGEVS
jgi:hypothetical protein